LNRDSGVMNVEWCGEWKSTLHIIFSPIPMRAWYRICDRYEEIASLSIFSDDLNRLEIHLIS
jgi:hypothetical protein